MEIKKVLDAKGLACPMPIVKAKKAMDELTTGDILEIQATDTGSKSDVSAWAESGGHELLEQTDQDGILRFLIKKG